MMNITHLKSKITLGEYPKTIGALFLLNKEKFGNKPAFSQRVNDDFQYWTWDQVVNDILNFANYLYDTQGLKKHERVAIVSVNSYFRYVAEMAVMASGLVSVPIFPGYPVDNLNKIIEFSDVSLLIIEDAVKFEKLDKSILPPKVLLLNEVSKILNQKTQNKDDLERTIRHFHSPQTNELVLIMYTSGTTNFPKGVMLTHHNILSQQRSIELLWKLESGLRFLCYLPWHHSFGGLFERFLTIYNGGCLAIDDSYGKNIDRLFSNFEKIRPHIYFSVPQVYQQIVAKVLTSKEHKNIFFHPELKFVFTAAAPLPLSSSSIFIENKVPVVEGWGLTETSPCCTLTEISLERTVGFVGFPIPEVEIKLTDENEILVKGTNVMLGYFKNQKATEEVLGQDGWFNTGDVGELSSNGVKIISRKDKIFKLSNAEKVNPDVIEAKVQKKCNFISHIYVLGNGEPHPMALIFPNFEILRGSKCNLSLKGCLLPENLQAFQGCLKNCLCEINDEMKVKYEKIKKAVIIDRVLSIELGELTPSMKLVPRIVEKNYREYIECLKSGDFEKLPKDAYVMMMN